MKKTAIVFTLLIIAILILLTVFGCISRSGKAAGLIRGKLAECPARPNCVCSERKDDTDHYIEPVTIPRNTDTLEILREAVRESGGVIKSDTGTYIAVTYSSALFGFVDDLEIRIDSEQNVIHIRSASRIGYSDFGVNRKRTELIKKLFYKKAEKADR
ncbi:DUF1499 domain-containing protein [Desulfobacterales bacterium HSG2]|nr:DUF1499 domain-containing protein [Desulfobacterales bacterium HSG2]